MTHRFHVQRLDYVLPKDFIAQKPAEPRDSSRLFVLENIRGQLHKRHLHFRDLLSFFKKDDVVVFNNSRVIPCRLEGQTLSGGKVEVFLLSPQQALSALDSSWTALLRLSGSIHPGFEIALPGGAKVLIESTSEERKLRGGQVLLRLKTLEPWDLYLEKYGHTPLPPYLQREDTPEDRSWYQTLYASQKGSCAAPTAGLHWTPELLTALSDRGVHKVEVTLHVGLGTFQPLQSEDVRHHKIHEESFQISSEAQALLRNAKQNGHRIYAVGTTSARVIETWARLEKDNCINNNNDKIDDFSGTTRLFIVPGDEFLYVNTLITNFHQPKSTLMLLVAAALEQAQQSVGRKIKDEDHYKDGIDTLKDLYNEAQKLGYRFFSYGDAMMIDLTPREESSL